MSTFLLKFGLGGMLLCQERKLHGVAVRRSKDSALLLILSLFFLVLG